MNARILATTIACSGLALAAQATTWDLTSQYQAAAANGVNGAWSYGEISGGNGGTFSSLGWTPVVSPLAAGIYGTGNGAFVYQNTASFAAYGIAPGQVTLESDLGNAAVQWTAPSTGVYDIVAAIGGTTATEWNGYGNNFAQFAGLNINGVSQGSSLVNNVKNWDITDVSLAAGQTIDVYVLNPGYANGGNTQTELAITSVPDGGMTISLLGGALAGLGALRRKPSL
jgi:hypothetical protein